MTIMEYCERLKSLGACQQAIDWSADQSDPQTAWERCGRADWLLWLAAWHCQPGDALHRAIVSAICGVARTLLRLVPEGEDRPRIAIETAEVWAHGEASIEDVLASAVSACAAAAHAAAASAHVAAAYAVTDSAATSAAYADIVRAHIPKNPAMSKLWP